MKARVLEDKEREKEQLARSKANKEYIKRFIKQRSIDQHQELLPTSSEKTNTCPDLIVEKVCDCPDKCNCQNAECTLPTAVPLVNEDECTIKQLAMKDVEGAQILGANEPGSGCATFKRIVADGSIIIFDTPDQIILSADTPDQCEKMTINAIVTAIYSNRCAVDEQEVILNTELSICFTRICATVQAYVPALDLSPFRQIDPLDPLLPGQIPFGTVVKAIKLSSNGIDAVLADFPTWRQGCAGIVNDCVSGKTCGKFNAFFDGWEANV